MGKRDERYTLEGMIEMDEGYFTVESRELEQEKGIRGRGAVGKQNVAVMAESTPLENIETGETSKSCRYFKAIVLEDHTAEGINETIKESLAESSIVFTDQSTSYVDISQLVEIHISEKSSKSTAWFGPAVLSVFPCCRDPVLPLLLGFLRGPRQVLARPSFQ